MPETISHPPVKEWGADAAAENRPGVPMEKMTGVQPRPIARQAATVPVVHKRAELGELTPTFGTSCPPKGLSGMMREAAYQIPDNRASHWMMLMMADRVDMVESTLGELVRKPSAALFLTLGAAAATIALIQPRRRRSFVGGWL